MTEFDDERADLWTYPETFGRIDVSGYRVEAADGEIGKVDEATLDLGASYLVVETGPLIFGKKVLIPAGIVVRIDRDEESVFLARTKDEISGAPEFDSDRYRDDDYRDAVADYYSRRGSSDDEPSDA